MKARALIEGSSFSADTVRLMGEAFDAAWDEIRHGIIPAEVEATRLRLASAVLQAAQTHKGVETLKEAALQTLGYASGPPP